MTTRSHTRTHKTKRWSRAVTEHSHALDLEPKVFAQDDPHAIALSLKRSAEHSQARPHTQKRSPFRSAMSMLTFYMNRAGSRLSSGETKKLERTKEELRRLFRRGNITKTHETAQGHARR